LDELRRALTDPKKVDPVKVSESVAEARVGIVHEELRNTSLDTDASSVFEMLVRTYAALDRLNEKDRAKEHHVEIKKTTRKGSQ
jgi:hypothetical protein